MRPENICPVCGYEMEAPPKDYRICPSCGTEFGVHDVNSTIADLREAWMKTGPKWWSRTDVVPARWDPIEQMEKAGIVVKRQPASQPISVSTSTSTARVGERNVTGWTAAPSEQPGDISRVMEPRYTFDRQAKC
jgi:hypothetical protein